ncbi:1-aminocyclopropane-1-carboxylate deaminase/D-cysteine desulfhydrase [Sungkyunkwania multivorans]|uniref:1-aminocyclopropane-1-carboxylate deaminase/D-cysteine desulfhydrase n=1 Tax=Sungkyunkwania multivorans TaxID=1173618 RepID=A0ABW3D0Q1_9FLAO
MFKDTYISKNQEVSIGLPYDVRLFVKREDEIDSFISGNKFRKLKYNVLEAERIKAKVLITFGGAFSNHIAAVARAGQVRGFATVGIIRGEELASKIQGNPTLKYAQNCGMELEFISRENYRQKDSAAFLQELNLKYNDVYIIPEGGTNDLAVKGCEEIVTPDDRTFDVIACCVGTGGTISGIINSSKPEQLVLGFPALKGDFLKEEIRKFAQKDNWNLIADYHFGGYAKVNRELIAFLNTFKKSTGIPLDPVYTGKMAFGIINLIKNGYFKKGSRILMIHTGGLQGIAGMNKQLKKRKLPLIDT